MAINPFQAPINYAVDVQSPFEAALGGFKLGAGVAEVEANRAARERALTAQTALGDLFKNPNATAADYARVTAFLPKDQAAIVQQGFEAQTKEQQQNTLKKATQVFTAIKSGNLPVAQMQLTEEAQALRNLGREKDAQGYDDLANLIRLNPTNAQTIMGLNIAQLPGGTAFLENADKALSTQREEALAPAKLQEALAKATQEEQKALNAVATARDDIAKAEADRQLAQAQADKAKVEADVALATKPSVISEAASKADEASIKAAFAERLQQAGLNLNAAQVRNINSEISNRAAKLNLDTQTMQATVAEKLSNIQKNLTELPADTRKLVNESAVLAASAKQSAGQFNDLAKRLEAAGGGYGVFSNASELVKKGLGLQGGMSQLRQEYTRLRNTAAVKSLPPGPATDRDIQIFFQPFPSDTADARYMASFLRGMAKVQDIEASVANAKTDWLANNNGVLTRARNTFQAGDYVTKPGESFNDFSQRVVQDVSKRYDPTQQPSLVEQIPTDANPRPAAAQSNIRSQADAILRGTP
jgi:hypothetical protein